MAEKITIEKVHAGYKLTCYPHRSLVVTAQDLLDVMDYGLRNARTLESEARIADALRRNAAMSVPPNEVEEESEE
jgi:hypothetical protein